MNKYLRMNVHIERITYMVLRLIIRRLWKIWDEIKGG